MSDHFSEEELATVNEAETGSPQTPHRPFVIKLVRLIHQRTGTVHSESWYRALMRAAGSTRKPSTRTVNAVVQMVKEEAGHAPGPTSAAVKILKGQYSGLVELVGRIEAAVERLSALTQRQVEISEAIDRRQLMFSDQSQVYQRQIDELSKLIAQYGKSSNEVAKGASDVALQSARTLRDIQTFLARGNQA